MTTASEWSPQSDVQLVRATMELFKGTSLTSNTIANSGSLSFTTQTYLYFDEGKWIEIIDNNNSSNWMAGQVTSYNELTGALVFAPKVKSGSGTIADWLIYSSGVWVNDPWNGGTVTNPVTINSTLAVTGTTTLAKVNSSAQISSTAGDVNLCTVTALADASATLSFAQIFNGVLTIAPTTARVLTLPSAATIIAALTGYEVGSQFTFTVLNTATSTVTIAPGTGVVMNGRTLFTEGSTTYLVRVDSATVVSVYNISQATTESNGVPGQISDGTKRKLTSLSGTMAWEVELAGISSVSSTVTTDTTLTSASAGYQFVQMATMGKSLTLPDATTMTVGGPKFIIDNTQGSYPCGIRNSAGTLLMAVAAGGEAYVSIKSISTAAGVWSITGTNLEPGLITIDNTFSSTYSSTVLAPFVALDDNKSIHFLALASGFAAVAVDKITGAVGTPVTVSAVASMVPRTAFKITSTTAIVFYSSTTGTLISVVISLSGATTLAIGTPSSTLTDTGVGVEDFSGVPKIAQLDSTHYLVSWATATGAGNTSVAAFEVTSGTTVTLGSTVNIIAANNVINSTTTYALTATTALVLYKSGAGAPYANNGVVISVSGAACSVGTPAALTGVGSSLTAVASSCLLSATKCLVQDDNNTAGSVIASVFTVSGTAVTAGTLVSVETGITTSSSYTANSATRYNPHLFPLSASTALLWYFDSSSVSRAVVLSESGGTVTKGSILYNSICISGTSADARLGRIMPQGVSDFCVLGRYGDYYSTIGNVFLSPHKLSGTTITVGRSSACLADLGGVSSLSSDYWSAIRLTNGKQLIFTGTNVLAPIAIGVFSSNGDAVNYGGSIKLPRARSAGSKLNLAVSSNRIVILHETLESTINADSTYQLRLLNVEIAA